MGGELRGTPEAVGAYEFTVEVGEEASRRDRRAFDLTVYEPLIMVSVPQESTLEGTAYEQVLSAEGGSGEGYVWRVIDGMLPAGLSLSSDASEATLSGVTVSAGTFGFTLK